MEKQIESVDIGGIPRKKNTLRSFTAIAGLVAAQTLGVCGCVGEIKPSRHVETAVDVDDCEKVMQDESDENNEARIACMEAHREQTGKRCKKLQSEETNAENVGEKLDCLEYKYRTDPPREGVSVFSWH